MIIHDISILNGPFRPTFNWGAPSPVEVALWFDYSKYIFLLIVLREDRNRKPWFFTTYCRGFRFRFSLNQSIDSVYSVNLLKNQQFIDEYRLFSHENLHVCDFPASNFWHANVKTAQLNPVEGLCGKPSGSVTQCGLTYCNMSIYIYIHTAHNKINHPEVDRLNIDPKHITLPKNTVSYYPPIIKHGNWNPGTRWRFIATNGAGGNIYIYDIMIIYVYTVWYIYIYV